MNRQYRLSSAAALSVYEKRKDGDASRLDLSARAETNTEKVFF